jgi:tetratricopeptide (TPR) repeat protein
MIAAALNESSGSHEAARSSTDASMTSEAVSAAYQEGLRLLPSDPRAALAAFERGLALAPDNQALRLQRIQALVDLDRHGAALPEIDSLLGQRPDLHVLLLLRVDSLLALLLNEQAIDQVQRALRVVTDKPWRERLTWQFGALTDPGQPRPVPPKEVGRDWQQAGHDELGAQRYEEAEDRYRRAVYADPEDAGHAAALAACLFMMADARPGALAECLALFDDADRRTPNDRVILFNWASALKKAGRVAEAMALVRRLRQLTPDDPHLDVLEQDVRAALPQTPPATVAGRPAFGCGPERMGDRMCADGLLVDPDLHVYAAWDVAGTRAAARRLQPLLDTMAALLQRAAGPEEFELPYGYDPAQTYHANVLSNAVRAAQAMSVGSSRFDVAAAIVAEDVATVTFTGDARCVLVRGADVYRLGTEGVACGYKLEVDDVLVLATAGAAARAAARPAPRGGRAPAPPCGR